MAEPVMKTAAWIAGGVLFVAQAALAQALPDPTRPPDALNPVVAAGPSESGPVLQSVLVSRGRRVAVISGEEVRQNGKFREWLVVRIGETDVVLRKGKEVQKLTLFPGMERQQASRAEGGKAGKRRQEKAR